MPTHPSYTYMNTSPILVALVAAFLVTSVPFGASAATTVPACANTSTPGAVEISINAASLTSSSHKPSIGGEACGTKTVRLTLQKDDNDKAFFKSKIIKVKKDGTWKTKITKKLKNGVYHVSVAGVKGIARDTVATGTLTIAKNSKSTSTSKGILAVSSIPLLSGGVAHSNASVPVAYLQITNTGKESVSLKGFNLKQRGSASTASIMNLTTIDDRGGSQGTSISQPFKKETAFVPTDAIFAPGQTRLFTIRALIGSNTASYSNKTIVLEITSIDSNAPAKGTFPIQGVTWTIQ